MSEITENTVISENSITENPGRFIPFSELQKALTAHPMQSYRAFSIMRGRLLLKEWKDYYRDQKENNRLYIVPERFFEELSNLGRYSVISLKTDIGDLETLKNLIKEGKALESVITDYTEKPKTQESVITDYTDYTENSPVIPEPDLDNLTPVNFASEFIKRFSPDAEGCYCFYDPKREINFYVGKTKNFLSRVAAHIKFVRFDKRTRLQNYYTGDLLIWLKKYGFRSIDSIRIKIWVSDNNRELENFLIDNLNPIFNKAGMSDDNKSFPFEAIEEARNKNEEYDAGQDSGLPGQLPITASVTGSLPSDRFEELYLEEKKAHDKTRTELLMEAKKASRLEGEKAAAERLATEYKTLMLEVMKRKYELPPPDKKEGAPGPRVAVDVVSDDAEAPVF